MDKDVCNRLRDVKKKHLLHRQGIDSVFLRQTNSDGIYKLKLRTKTEQ
jgi:hypothetical protein